ncbi:hypothetical protein HHI36_010187 [Cryptolaemus montrouzieri]|uniref:Transposase n=1 Tax=Cryptolaemus montrouzieri TaxID=559131 RepID=A0ABD2MI43_9CUCU
MRKKILDACEIIWVDCSAFKYDGHVVYHPGGNDRMRGVAIIVSEYLNKAVNNYFTISDRMMLVQFQGTQLNINVLQVYAPTADNSQLVINNFHQQLGETLKYTK